MKILKFNKYSFIKENLQFLNEDNFNQYDGAAGATSPMQGFAVDNQLSIYGSQDSPYTDAYYRKPYMLQKIVDILKNVSQELNYDQTKFDYFLDDIDEFKNLKILRINKNDSLTLDVFISFMFGEEEFFGVYKKFNGIEKPHLISDLFTDGRFAYIDNEYVLKLDNYLYKLLTNWFKPLKGYYEVLNDSVPCKNEMGELVYLKKGQKIKVIEINIGGDRCPYIKVELNGVKLYIIHNNYYYFNYWFEKLPEIKF